MKLRVLSHKLQRLHQNASWREVARKYDITPALAWRIANQEYEPKSPLIRRKLGLPAQALADTCPTCGKVHVTTRCPDQRKPKVIRLWEYTFGELRYKLDKREPLDG